MSQSVLLSHSGTFICMVMLYVIKHLSPFFVYVLSLTRMLHQFEVCNKS